LTVAERLTAQLLSGEPARDPVAVTERLVLLGWVSREPLLDVDQAIVTVNGVFRPFALVRGRAAALWKLDGGKVAIEPFARLTKQDAAALAADARDVVRFLGLDG
jgi:hypothetical protein